MSEGFHIDDFLRVPKIDEIVSEKPVAKIIAPDVYANLRRDEFLITPRVRVMPTPMREVPSKDEYYISLLPVIASRSKDTNQVGCILVGPGGEIRCTGYNGFPQNVMDSAARWERPNKYNYVAHAEINCIAHAARVGTPIDRCTAYVSFMPCKDCTKALINAGIESVIVDKQNHDTVTSEKWENDKPYVLAMFRESWVKLMWYDREQGEMVNVWSK